jgi:hypothetical protein
MKQQAARMILGMMAVAVLITAISGTLLPLVIMIAVGYVTWHTAKGLDG